MNATKTANATKTELRNRTAGLLAASVRLYEGQADDVAGLQETLGTLRDDIHRHLGPDIELDRWFASVAAAFTLLREGPADWRTLAGLVSAVAALHDEFVQHIAVDRELARAC